MRNKTYINSGFNLTATSMQTQKPFGGDNWSNSTLTTKESTLLNWVGKEKDNESNLGDHGVRKYEHETGRFISIDPLWSNYFGWTPYQYSMNSPVMLVDVGGMVVEALDKNMQNGIKSNIEPQYRNYVTFVDNIVNINLTKDQLAVISMNKNFANSNFDKLIQMSNSTNEVFTLKSVNFASEKIEGIYSWAPNGYGKMYANSTLNSTLKEINEQGDMYMTKVNGIFLGAEIRDAVKSTGEKISLPSSASGKSEIYIDKTANAKKIVSHEFFEGHAWFYFNGWDHGESNVFGK